MTGPFSFPPSTVWGDSAFYWIQRGNDRSDWANDLISAEGHVASSNTTIVQYDGYTLWELTIECWFLGRDAWQAFNALRGTAATMRHPAALTAQAPRTAIRQYPDGPYAVFDNVTLHATRDARPHPAYPDVMMATATFRRTYEGDA